MSFSFSSKDNGSRSPGDLSSVDPERIYWKPLLPKHITALNEIFFHKEFALRNKREDYIVTGFKAHQLFEAVIGAYIRNYAESRVRGSSISTNFEEMMRVHDLSVVLCVKGSTAADIFEGKPASNGDLDSLIKFNSLPHDPTDFSKNLQFYRKVAFEAMLSLLNLKYGDVSRSLNPSEFFENLILFSDNSCFLVSFGSVDFAFPVPFVRDGSGSPIISSSTFLHESIQIQIPFQIPCDGRRDGRRIRTDHGLLGSEFAVDFEMIQSSFAERIICIPEPEGIKHNGIERLVYSLTKGWTTIDEVPVQVLINEFAARAKDVAKGGKETRSGAYVIEYPLDRLYKLVTKKQLQAACNLNVFMNAFLLINHFAEEGSESATYLKDEMLKAFSEAKWRTLFPGFVSSIFLEKEKTVRPDGREIDTFKPKIQALMHWMMVTSHLSMDGVSLIRPHLNATVRIFGKEGKNIGFFLSPTIQFKDLVEILEEIKQEISKENLNELIYPLLATIHDLPIPFEKQLLFFYVMRCLSQSHHVAEELLELRELFPQFMDLLFEHPELIRRVSIQPIMQNFIDRNPTFLEVASSDRTFLHSIVENPELFSLFPLYFSAITRSKEIFQEKFLSFKDHPLIEMQQEMLVRHFFEFSDLLSPTIFFTLFESIMKMHHRIIPNEMIEMRLKEVLTALKDEAVLYSFDKEFWIAFFNERLSREYSTSFLTLTFGFLEEVTLNSVFLHKLYKEDLSDDLKRKIFRFAKEKTSLDTLEKISLDPSPLIIEQFERFKQESPNLFFYTVLCFDHAEKYFNQIVEIIPQIYLKNHSVLENKNFIKFLQKLDPTLVLELINSFIDLRDDNKQRISLTLLHSIDFLAALAPSKKKFRKVLLKAIKDKQYPVYLNAAILEFFLHDQNERTFSDDDFKFSLYCLKYLELESEENSDLFIRYLQIAGQKLVCFHREILEKEQELFKKICSMTVAVRRRVERSFSKEWLDLSTSLVMNENSLEELLLQKDANHDNPVFVETVQRKLTELDTSLASATVESLIDLFSHNVKGLKNLITKLEERRQEEYLERVYERFFLIGSHEEKFTLFKIVKNQELLLTSLEVWLKEIFERKEFRALSPVQLGEIARFLISQTQENLKLFLLNILVEIPEFKTTFASLYFELFYSCRHLAKQEIALSIFITFDRLDGVNQSKLLFDRHIFTADGEKSLLDLACADSRYLAEINGILDKANKATCRIRLDEMKDRLEEILPIMVHYTHVDAVKFCKKFLLVFKSSPLGMTESSLQQYLQMELTPEYVDQLQEAIFSVFDRISTETLYAFVMKKVQIQPSLKNATERAMFDKLMAKLIDEKSVHFMIDLIHEMNKSSFLTQDQVAQFVFKLVLNSMKERNFVAVEEALTIQNWKNFSKIIEKSKKQFLNSVEGCLKDASSRDELAALSLVFAQVISYFGKADSSDRLLFAIFEKYLDLPDCDINDKLQFIEILSRTFSKDNWVNPKEKVFEFQKSQILILVSKLLASSDYSNCAPLMFISDRIKPCIPLFFKKYIEKLLTDHFDLVVHEWRFYRIEKIGSMLDILENHFESSEIPESKQQELVDGVIFKMKEMMNHPELSDAAAIGLLKSAQFLRKKFTREKASEIVELFLTAFIYLSTEKYYFLTKDVGFFTVIKEISDATDEMKELIFSDENRDKMHYIYRQMSYFMKLTPELVVIEKSDKSPVMTVEQLIDRLKEWKTQILIGFLDRIVSIDKTLDSFYTFCIMVKMAGIPNLKVEYLRIKGTYTSLLYEVGLRFLQDIPAETVLTEEPEDFLLHEDPEFLTKNEETKRRVITSTFFQLFIHANEHALNNGMDDWLKVPIIIRNFIEKGYITSDTKKLDIVNTMRSSAGRILYKLGTNPDVWKMFWPLVAKGYLVNYRRFAEAIGMSIVEKLILYKFQRMIFYTATKALESEKDFDKADHERMFIFINPEDFNDCIHSLKFNREIMEDPFELKIDNFKGLFCLLTCLKLKEEMVSIEHKNEIYRLSLSYFQAILTHYLSDSRLHSSKEIRHSMLSMAFKLKNLMPNDLFGMLFESLLRVLAMELDQRAVAVRFFEQAFKLIHELGAITEAKQLLDMIRSRGKYEIFLESDYLPFILELEEHESRESCTLM
jgi:hypothetical protein